MHPPFLQRTGAMLKNVMKDPTKKATHHKARILIFTGDGKGKTTAALGMALRAAGHGMRTRILQFLKAEDKTGEITASKAFPHVEIQQVGKGFVPKPSHPQFASHKTAAEHGLMLATEAVQSGQYELIVLDEICTALQLQLLAEADIIQLIKRADPDLIIALTGRGATPAILELADTATEMRCIKHSMDTGHPAQKGCEY